MAFACVVFCSKDLVAVDNCKIQFVDEIFAIEKPGSQINLLSLNNDEAAPTLSKLVCGYSSFISYSNRNCLQMLQIDI